MKSDSPSPSASCMPPPTGTWIVCGSRQGVLPSLAAALALTVAASKKLSLRITTWRCSSGGSSEGGRLERRRAERCWQEPNRRLTAVQQDIFKLGKEGLGPQARGRLVLTSALSDLQAV
eukprot:762522-Hanusia_phi.AAC.4